MKQILNILFFFTVLLPSSKAEKHGLVIAIGDYSEESLWPDISSSNDIPHITTAIKMIGFKNEKIRILVNGDATKAAIVAAFKELEENVQPGDMVYIHYSGHGQQIVDDNGDELDGLDEAIVPHDSPLFFEEGIYEGEQLIRDDLIGELTLAIRMKLGQKGQLILVMDSCHSGSGTRGLGKARGTGEIMAPLDFKPNIQEEDIDMGIIVSDTKASPMASFFGASANELNYETIDDQSNPVGSLSYAFASTLAKMNKNYSASELFERVKLKMKHLAPNQNPKMEASEDMFLFGEGNPTQELLYPIKEVISSTELVIGVGTITEVYEGSIIEVVSLEDESVKGTGEVITAMLTECDILMDEPISIQEGELWKVRVMEKMQPEISCHVQNLVSAESDWSNVIQEVMKNKLVKENQEVADLYFNEDDGKLILSDAQGLVLFEKRFSENRATYNQSKINNIIGTFTQGKYIRSFVSDNSFLNLTLEIKQVDCEDQKNELDEPTDQISVGSCIKLRVSNEGKKAAYFSVLDIQPDNYINLIIPAVTLGYTPSEYYLEPGEVFETNYTIEIAPPYGNELMKLISTDEPVDLSAIMRSKGSQTRGNAPDHSFGQIMASTYGGTQTRGAKVKKPSLDEVGTFDKFFKIIE